MIERYSRFEVKNYNVPNEPKIGIWRYNPRTGLKEVQVLAGELIPKTLRRDGWKPQVFGGLKN